MAALIQGLAKTLAGLAPNVAYVSRLLTGDISNPAWGEVYDVVGPDHSDPRQVTAVMEALATSVDFAQALNDGLVQIDKGVALQLAARLRTLASFTAGAWNITDEEVDQVAILMYTKPEGSS